MSANAADRKSIRAAEKAASAVADRRAAVTRNIMSTVEGREWMWDVLSSCHVFGQTFVPGSPDITAFSEGQRAVGLRLLADILNHCPDAYIEAQREANVRHTTDERRSSSVADRGDSGPVADDVAGDPSDDPADGTSDFPALLSDDQLRAAAEARSEAAH